MIREIEKHIRYVTDETYEFYGWEENNTVYLHRENGPALIVYKDGAISRAHYFLFNKKITKSEFEDEDFKQTFIMEHG